MIVIPKQLQNYEFRFIKLQKKSKMPITGEKWKDNLLKYNDKSFKFNSFPTSFGIFPVKIFVFLG